MLTVRNYTADGTTGRLPRTMFSTADYRLVVVVAVAAAEAAVVVLVYVLYAWQAML